MGILRSHLAPGNLDGAVRDDLVHVHIGLRAAAGLPDAQGELVVKFADDDLVGGLHDQLGFVRGKFAKVMVHERAGLFQRAESVDQFGRHCIAPNVEVQQRALRLRAPINVSWDFDLSHAVGFGAGVSQMFHCGSHSMS